MASTKLYSALAYVASNSALIVYDYDYALQMNYKKSLIKQWLHSKTSQLCMCVSFGQLARRCRPKQQHNMRLLLLNGPNDENMALNANLMSDLAQMQPT